GPKPKLKPHRGPLRRPRRRSRSRGGPPRRGCASLSVVGSAKPTLSATAKHDASRIYWRRLVIDYNLAIRSTETRNARPPLLIRKGRKIDRASPAPAHGLDPRPSNLWHLADGSLGVDRRLFGYSRNSGDRSFARLRQAEGDRHENRRVETVTVNGRR